jgi:hypothetical protein
LERLPWFYEFAVASSASSTDGPSVVRGMAGFDALIAKLGSGEVADVTMDAVAPLELYAFWLTVAQRKKADLLITKSRAAAGSLAAALKAKKLKPMGKKSDKPLKEKVDTASAAAMALFA